MDVRGPVIPAAAVAAGIAISGSFDPVWWTGIIPLAIAIGLYLQILSRSGDPVKAFRLNKLHTFWIVLLFTGIGMLDEGLQRPMKLVEAFGEDLPELLTCKVTGVSPRTYGDRLEVIIQSTNRAKARIMTQATEFDEGDLLAVPSRFLKDISADTTETARKIAPVLQAKGILYTGYIPEKYISRVGETRCLTTFFSGIRRQIEIKIDKSHLPIPVADFLNAVVLGDKSGIDDSVRLSFANGGTAHMLALSGLHLGIIAGFLLLLLWPLKTIGKYKWTYGIAIVLVWLYIAVTGMPPSAVRAGLMITISSIAVMAERRNIALNALASACLIILVADPSSLFDAGFQLSIVCVAGLICFTTSLNPIHHRQHPILFWVCGSILATMTATAASWPLTSYYFSQIPLMFLPANVVLLPVLPVYISISAIFVILLCFGYESSLLLKILKGGYDLLLRATDFLSGGDAFVVKYQLPGWGVALWMALLVAFAIIIGIRHRKNCMNP